MMSKYKKNIRKKLMGALQVEKIKYLLLVLMMGIMPAMSAVNMTAVEFNSLPGVRSSLDSVLMVRYLILRSIP